MKGNIFYSKAIPTVKKARKGLIFKLFHRGNTKLGGRPGCVT
jgi:hypothetical protein